MSLGSFFVPSNAVLRRIRRAEWLEQHGSVGRRAGHLVRYRLGESWGVFVNASAQIGAVRFEHPTSVVIGAGAVVEDGVRIWQNVTIGADDVGGTAYPTIRRGARLFAGCCILGGIVVGEGATVGANSVVVRDVRPGAVVVGAPAREAGGR